jgi:hypothetical protein
MTSTRTATRRFTTLLLAAATGLAVAAAPASADLPATSDEDITAPSLSGLSVTPTLLDVTDGVSKDFTATITATDDLSGVTYSSVGYSLVGGSRSIDFSFGGWEGPTTGTRLDGTYTSVATVTPQTAAGTYRLSFAAVYDEVGNYRFYDASQLSAPDLHVVSNADVIPPVIESVSLSSHEVDVTDGFKAVQATTIASDVGSGIAFVFANYYSPSTRQSTGFFTHPSESGELVSRMSVAKYAQAGDWKPAFVCASDVAGNQTCLGDWMGAPTDVFSGPLHVTSLDADSADPVAHAFRLNPGAIDVTHAAAMVQTDIDVSDVDSGVSYIHVRFDSPPTPGASPEVMSRYGFASATSPLVYGFLEDGTYDLLREDESLRMRSGTLSAHTLFPRYDRSGAWKVAEVCVTDNVNNTSCYDATTTPPITDLGDTELPVEWNRTPAAAVNGITETSYPAGSEPSPSCTVTDVEDGVRDVNPLVTTSADGTLVTVTCSYTDSGGLTGSATKSYTVVAPLRDLVAPALTVADVTAEATSPAGATVDYTATAHDLVDGDTPVSCSPTSGSTFPLSATAVTCSSTDLDGNTATATFSVTVVDTTAPTAITFGTTGIQSGGTYHRDDDPAQPTCTATDAVTLEPTCVVTAGSDSAGHFLTATATDAAGNTDTATIRYTLRTLNLGSFSAPLDPAPILNVIKGGNTVPVKFRVFDGATEVTTTAGMSTSYTAIKCPTATTDVVETSTSAAGNALRYDSTGGQFIQNWKTPAGSGLCYRFTLTTSDGSTLTALFKTK